MASDPHRPRYHFLPPANWMNDPNGLIQWHGEYHLFYQHNPVDAVWGAMCWAHAVSEDLIHWTHLPIALAPTPNSPDRDGVWSGVIVNHNGTPTAIYTGVVKQADGYYTQRPCLATSMDGLRTWHKYAGNPIIQPPHDLNLLGFRDHSLWNESGVWHQAIGSGIQNVGGAILLYRSSDLYHWEYLRPLCVGNANETGTLWECPDFFALGDKHALVISPIPLNNALCALGTYIDNTFTPESWFPLDAPNGFYAPQSFLDEQGRRIMFGWIREHRSEQAQRAAGWSGVMSLPRIISLNADEALRMTPAPEIELLRGHHRQWRDLVLSPTTKNVLPGARGDTLEMFVEFELGTARQVGIKLRATVDDCEHTDLIYDRVAQCLIFDRTHSSLDEQADHTSHSLPLALADGERLRVRVFLDRSVIECFVNERVCLTTRVYPTRADSQAIDLFARDGMARACAVELWEIR